MNIHEELGSVFDSNPSWRILLIGGVSGVGKSFLAQHISRHSGISVMQVDDIRLALQSVTTLDQQPGLHFFVNSDLIAKEGIWSLNPEQLCEGLITVGQIVSKALLRVIGHHVATDSPLIIEGDGILPSIVERIDFGIREKVSTVFLVEPDERMILNNMIERGRGFEEANVSEQQTQAKMNWLFGQHIQREAGRLQLPILPPRPYSTLNERALRLLKFNY